MMFEDLLNGSWDLTILDADPPSGHLGSLAAGDFDGDGRVEVFIGGWHDQHPSILCYRPATLERWRVADRCCGVGLVLEDVDGDGTLELATTLEPDELCWLKPGADPRALWTTHTIDAGVTGCAHDLVFADVDGDGERELVANSISGPVPGLHVYKKGEAPSSPWLKSVIQEGFFEEGLAAGDVDGDGRLEILSGTHWCRAPATGPFTGPWEQHTLAPGFREMVRVALADVTGSGLPDAVVCESEYLDGRMSWFENRFGADPPDPWLEHPVDRGLYYAHSIWAAPARPGRMGIVSHGWKDSRYVHLWEVL